jgi:hypothetical protein
MALPDSKKGRLPWSDRQTAHLRLSDFMFACQGEIFDGLGGYVPASKGQKWTKVSNKVKTLGHE